MGGKFSRNKGRREEQQLVLALYKLGFKAERILRQYQGKGLPDVQAVKNDKTYTFEMKSRREQFKSIYNVYHQEKDHNGVFAFYVDLMGAAVAMSTDLMAIFDKVELFRKPSEFKEKDLRILKRVMTFEEQYKQDADFLVIRDNQSPRLYIRYWSVK